MRFLTERQRETLRAVCDTIKPGQVCESAEKPHGQPVDAFGYGADELGISDLIEKALYERDDEASRLRLQLLLGLLDRRVFNGWLAGHWQRFARMNLAQRTAVLQAMAVSNFNALRAAFHSLKQLASFLSYAHYPPLGDNPIWPALGYEGRAASPVRSFAALPTVEIEQAERNGHQGLLDCDVLVIGSGAGGGVVAAELAADGHDVVVIEKGKQFANHEMPATELAGMRELYEGKGSFATADRGMIVLAGSTLGGGTTVNWMTCLRPPEQLLAQWSREFGFRGAASREFAASVETVSERLGVTTSESAANQQNGLIERGCRELGYGVTVIPRNVRGCVKCDFCGFGCRYGAKQDTRSTFLHDAVAHGARIIVRATVDKIHHRRGAVTGASVTVTDRNGKRHAVRVRCKAVVSAAGSIHTPAILLRSGLENPHIGGNLHLHPVAAVYARYDSLVESWKGAPQTRLCDEFADLDGQGFGFRLEASPAHPGLWGVGLPWFCGESHRDAMRQLPYLANIIVLTRDRYAGHVTLGPQGSPRLHYRLHPYDAGHMMQGIETALRVQRAAGARQIFGPHNDSVSFRGGQDRDFERFLGHVRGLGVRPNHIGMFCAHQMSSCRIGGSAAQGALSPEGESYEVRNLFVADGSVMPTSTGVNPMITIMSTAHHIAQHVKQRLASYAVCV